MNAGIAREIAQCRLPVESRKIPLIPHASRVLAALTGAHTVVSAIDLNTAVDEDEVCAAQL